MKRVIEIPPEKIPGEGARALWHMEDRSVALFNVEGTLHAIDDRCPHAGASLFAGSVTGRVVQCRAHGLRFDLATGCMPNVASFGVRRYDVEARDGRTFLVVSDGCQS